MAFVRIIRTCKNMVSVNRSLKHKLKKGFQFEKQRVGKKSKALHANIFRFKGSRIKKVFCRTFLAQNFLTFFL